MTTHRLRHRATRERQQLLTHILAPRGARIRPVDGAQIEFFDLFCGIGGASAGAERAGYRVECAIDLDAEALNIHSALHPGCRHFQMHLPSRAVPLPEDGRRFHVHGSPPCTRLSVAGHTTLGLVPTEHARVVAIGMVEWFIDFCLGEDVHGQDWSLEQVPHPSILAILKDRRSRNKRVDFEVFDCAQLGLAQNRNRVIAGPPELIDKLRWSRQSIVHAPSIQSALSLPADVMYMRGTKTNNQVHGLGLVGRKSIHPKQNSRSVQRPAFTITGSSNLRWMDRRFKTVRVLNLQERCLLQGLDAKCVAVVHSSRANAKKKYQLVGNAIPPLIVQQLLESENGS